MGVGSALRNTFSHIAHTLGLSRPSKSKLHGPVGNYKAIPVQAVHVQSWHQPSARFPGQTPATQLHQRIVYQVSPNYTLNIGNVPATYLTDSAAPAHLQNIHSQPHNAYNFPPSSTTQFGETSVSNFSNSQSLGTIPSDEPPLNDDTVKSGGVKAPVTPGQSTYASKTPEKPTLESTSLPEPDEMMKDFFPCCLRLNAEEPGVHSITEQEQIYQEAMDELNQLTADIKKGTLDEDDLDDLLYALEIPNTKLHGEELKDVAYEKLSEIRERTIEEYRDLKGDTASLIDETISSLESYNTNGLFALWLKYSVDDTYPDNVPPEQLIDKTRDMLITTKNQLVPITPDIVISELDSTDTQPTQANSPLSPPAPEPAKSIPTPPTATHSTATTNPALAASPKPATATQETPILTKLFSEPPRNALLDPAGSVGLPDKQSYQPAELEAHEQALTAEIKELKIQVSNMLTHLKAEEKTVSEDELSQLLQTTGLSRYLKTRTPHESLQEAREKIRGIEGDMKFAFKALRNRPSE